MNFGRGIGWIFCQVFSQMEKLYHFFHAEYWGHYAPHGAGIFAVGSGTYLWKQQLFGSRCLGGTSRWKLQDTWAWYSKMSLKDPYLVWPRKEYMLNTVCLTAEIYGGIHRVNLDPAVSGNWTSFLLQQGRPVVFYPEAWLFEEQPRWPLTILPRWSDASSGWKNAWRHS